MNTINENFELIWNGFAGHGNEGGSISGGFYKSRAEASKNTRSFKTELLAQCSDNEDQLQNIENGSFEVSYRGPSIVVDNIEVKNDCSNLYAIFTVRIIDDEGNERDVRQFEWIDLDDGLLESPSSNLMISGHLSPEEIRQVQGLVNDYLSDHPISEETLEVYRVAQADINEAQRAILQ